MKPGDLVCLAETFYPRAGSPQRKVFREEMGTVISSKAESDKSWSVCKVLWASGALTVHFSGDLEVISEV